MFFNIFAEALHIIASANFVCNNHQIFESRTKFFMNNIVHKFIEGRLKSQSTRIFQKLFIYNNCKNSIWNIQSFFEYLLPAIMFFSNFRRLYFAFWKITISNIRHGCSNSINIRLSYNDGCNDKMSRSVFIVQFPAKRTRFVRESVNFLHESHPFPISSYHNTMFEIHYIFHKKTVIDFLHPIVI